MSGVTEAVAAEAEGKRFTIGRVTVFPMHRGRSTQATVEVHLSEIYTLLMRVYFSEKANRYVAATPTFHAALGYEQCLVIHDQGLLREIRVAAEAAFHRAWQRVPNTEGIEQYRVLEGANCGVVE